MAADCCAVKIPRRGVNGKRVMRLQSEKADVKFHHLSVNGALFKPHHVSINYLC